MEGFRKYCARKGYGDPLQRRPDVFGDMLIEYVEESAGGQTAELRGSVKALQDEVAQLNRRLLELSLNASVRLGETK